MVIVSLWKSEKKCLVCVVLEAADFETALAATGFGKFNLILLLIAFPAALAPVFESTTMSYVFPAAQCDLDLSLQNKGTLNAITYLGNKNIWNAFCVLKLRFFKFLQEWLLAVCFGDFLRTLSAVRKF